MESIRDKIDRIKARKMKVCIFGAGKMGTGFWYDMLKNLQIEPRYFCDNDPDKWGKEVKDGIRCISPGELTEKENCACFILIGIFKINTIKKQLYDMGIETVVTFSDLYMLDEVHRIFYSQPYLYDEGLYRKRLEILEQGDERKIEIWNPNNKKIAVYTCITGNYEEVLEPKVISDECDYFVISDEKPKGTKIYQWIATKDVVPDWVEDHVRRNRYCKINGGKIFKNYRYSIYIDGSDRIIGDIGQYADRTGKCGIALRPHLLYPDLDVYTEAIQCVSCHLDEEDLIRWQIESYRKENMPANFGMFECGFIVRDHRNKLCQEIMERWWKEVFTRSSRDQLSFTYCLWKSGMCACDVGIIGKGRLDGGVQGVTTVHYHH